MITINIETDQKYVCPKCSGETHLEYVENLKYLDFSVIGKRFIYKHPESIIGTIMCNDKKCGFAFETGDSFKITTNKNDKHLEEQIKKVTSENITLELKVR